MDDFTRLLFGRDSDGLIDLIFRPSREERGAADRIRQSEQWCGSTPGDAPGPRELRGMRTRRPHRIFPGDFDI
jgi:hypothetical protein